MEDAKKEALLKKWKEWWGQQPEEIIFCGIILKKQETMGHYMSVLPVPLNLPNI